MVARAALQVDQRVGRLALLRTRARARGCAAPRRSSRRRRPPSARASPRAPARAPAAPRTRRPRPARSRTAARACSRGPLAPRELRRRARHASAASRCRARPRAPPPPPPRGPLRTTRAPRARHRHGALALRTGSRRRAARRSPPRHRSSSGRELRGRPPTAHSSAPARPVCSASRDALTPRTPPPSPRAVRVTSRTTDHAEHRGLLGSRARATRPSRAAAARPGDVTAGALVEAEGCARACRATSHRSSDPRGAAADRSAPSSARARRDRRGAQR